MSENNKTTQVKRGTQREPTKQQAFRVKPKLFHRKDQAAFRHMGRNKTFNDRCSALPAGRGDGRGGHPGQGGEAV